MHSALDTRVFHKQARTLAAAGYQVHLVAQHQRNEQRDGVSIHALPAGTPRLQRPLLWLRLIEQALRRRASVYHIHDPELLPLALALQRLTSRPFIYDAHEYYGDEVQTRRWIPEPLRAPAGWLTERVEKAIAARLAAAVTVNEHMNARFLQVQPRSIAVHNYPPAEYFAAPGQEAREQRVVYAGVLTHERGIETIYETGQLLHARYPELEIAIAGPIDWSGVAAGVPREATRWQTDAGVRFLGTLPQEQVPDVLRQAAVGWIPFEATPNNIRSTPNKLLEYMAAALPVVGSDFGYLNEIISSAGCGLLARAGSAAAHAQQIGWLIEHPAEAREMGDRGRQAVLEHYTWAPEGRKLIDLYDQLMGMLAAEQAFGR